MNILFIADIVGRPGRRAVSELLPGLIEQHDVSVCIANGENAAGGFGLTGPIVQELHQSGVDVITSGNHLWDRKEIIPLLEEDPFLLRPANYPPEVPGCGSAVFEPPGGPPVGIMNLQGRVFIGPIDCPFHVAERELGPLRERTNIVLVDIHAEATSEKIALGWYLDGRVSAVVGTHTHVQTADERILPEGTAYITDAGMTGPHDGVLGVKKEPVMERFLTQLPTHFETATSDVKLCGALLRIDEDSGHAVEISRVSTNLS
jgi:metallophosphoesterase (TIGR00282 family)